MARQRGDKGNGAIFRDTERGGYRLQITIDGHRYVRRAKTKTELMAKRARLLEEHARGTLAIDQTSTVADVLTRYVTRTVPNRKAGTLAPSSRFIYEWAAGHLISELGTKRASKLTRREVEAALDRLAERLGRSSLKKIRRVLVAALDEAVADRSLAYNVATTAQLPVEVKAGSNKQSLSPAMARRLLSALEDEPNGAMFALMLRVGLRPGEAAGLYWEEIRGQLVNVTRAVQLDHGRPQVVDRLKTAGSARTIEIPDDLVGMLDRHRKHQAETRLAAGSWIHPELVFASPRGGVLSPSNVRKQLASICQRAGVHVEENGTHRPPRPNELRHSCASLLSDEGVPNELIADLLGHTTTRMVDETYRHRLRPTVSVARDVNWAAG